MPTRRSRFAWTRWSRTLEEFGPERERGSALPWAIALVLLTTGCSDEAQFSTRFASDFAHGKHTVAVLGVFKDGRLSTEAWETLGPKLSAPFGATCDAGYSALSAKDEVLSAAVDDYVRANGPGDELLGQLAPAARGDLILVFTVAGRVVPATAPPADSSSMMSGGAPGGGMGMGAGRYRGARMPGTGGRMGRGPAPGPAAFEVSALLFSVAQRKSVGVIAMQYDGPSADEALQRMSAKLAAAIPGSACGGWDLSVPLDEQRIRALIEP
jgi:hypothetical protein